MKNEDWQKFKKMGLADWLSFINGDDDLGLTAVKAKSRPITADEHLVAKFQEINDFFKANEQLPENNIANISELMLYKRLGSIRANNQQCQALVDFDEFNLLPPTHEVAEPKPHYKSSVTEINSVDDIFADDDLGLLGDNEDSIFKMRHVKAGQKAAPDMVARREPIKDFDKYVPMFKQVHSELVSGTRKLNEFSENDLREGGYYVLDGVLLLLESVDYDVKSQQFESGARIRKDGRTKLVFDNGTGSNMLHRSLYKQLLKEGKTVTELSEYESEKFRVIDDDQSTGFIYVLRSKSSDAKIKSIPNLFKIGYSTVPVEKRIANAEREPTYLMAPVGIEASYECYNMNTQKFENLVHTVFKTVCIDVEIADLQGNVCKPREWFSVPIEQINTAIELIVNGQIVNYRYNSTANKIELKTD